MKHMVGGLGPDTTFSAHNTVVTANVSKALRRLQRGVPLDLMSQRALGLGADLLTNILQGSLFMESADVSGLTRPTSTEDVWAYSHALSVLQEFDLTKRKPLNDALKEIRDGLRDLAKTGTSTDPIPLDAVEKFFNTLNSIFYTDIYNGLLPQRAMDDDAVGGQ